MALAEYIDHSLVFFGLFIAGLAALFLAAPLNRIKVPPGLTLPPGPWGLPVIGAAFRLGKERFKGLTRLSKQYGEIFSLYIGSRLVVVLNGRDVIYEALVKQSTAFAGRPSLFTIVRASQGGKGLLYTSYGQKWKIIRKTAISAIHKYLVTENEINKILSRNTNKLIEQLRRFENQSHNLMPELKTACAGVILGILFGEACDKKDVQNILKISNRFSETVGAGLAIDFMPWLEYFPDSRIKRLDELLDDLKGTIGRLYFENRASYTKGKRRNVADSLQEEIDILMAKSSSDESSEYPEDNMEYIVALGDLFGAGFDTVSITLYFAIAYLAIHPEMQKRFHEEVDNVIGKDKKPEMKDLEDLKYCKAFIYELLRITSIAPLSVPHATIRDVTLRGHFIPEGTVVLANQWSVHHDKDIYKDPQQFNPDRFLDGEGRLLSPEDKGNFIPFGLGKRSCPGKVLADHELLFMLVNLVQQLEFTSKSLQEKKEIEVNVGLTIKPADYSVCIKQR